MADMIPASKIAAIAQARVAEAERRLSDLNVYGHSSDDLKMAKGALAVASELLALIVPAPEQSLVNPVPEAFLVSPRDFPVIEPAPGGMDAIGAADE